MDLLRGPEPQARPIAWRLRDVAWAGALAVVLFVAIGLLAALVGRALAPLGGSAAYMRGALMALAELAFLVPVWAFAVRRRGASWPDLGLRRFRPLLGCLGAALLLYVSLSLNVIWGLVLRALGWAGQPNVRPLFGPGPLGFAVALFGTALVAPLAEEVFFRGFVYPPLRRRLGLVWGIAVDAVLFSALHFTPTVFPPILALGVFFCLLYEYTGSLWPGMMLHAAINAFAVVAAYLLQA